MDGIISNEKRRTYILGGPSYIDENGFVQLPKLEPLIQPDDNDEEDADLRAAYPADPEPAEDDNWTK